MSLATVAMDTAFSHLLALLGDIADPRRAKGKHYGLAHVFLFSILAVMAGANSYSAIHSFIDVHLDRLKQSFELNWKRAPACTTVRGILQGLAAADVEKVLGKANDILGPIPTAKEMAKEMEAIKADVATATVLKTASTEMPQELDEVPEE